MKDPVKVSIEYCVPCGYTERAFALAQDLLNKYASHVQELTLIPSGNGLFEVIVDEELVFSKKEIGRQPKEGEILSLFEEKTGAAAEAA
jgi:selenoprotein W-related protein